MITNHPLSKDSIMSNNNNKSDLENAVKEVSPKEVADNLQSGSQTDAKSTTENLSQSEKTPFIDEELRTDK